jgi:hypothetical protein
MPLKLDKNRNLHVRKIRSRFVISSKPRPDRKLCGLFRHFEGAELTTSTERHRMSKLVCKTMLPDLPQITIDLLEQKVAVLMGRDGRSQNISFVDNKWVLQVLVDVVRLQRSPPSIRNFRSRGR